MNLVAFASLGTLRGVDPEPRAVEACRKRGLSRVDCAAAESLPFPDGSFDAAFLFDVIEHLEDDHAALHEAARVVRPGGSLVLTVPAYMWLWSSHDDSHHHRRRYTKSSIVRSMARSDWRVEYLTYFNAVLLAPIAVARGADRIIRRRGGGRGTRSDYQRTPAALNRILAAPMQLEARAVAHGAQLPAGVSIGLVAGRP